MTEKINYTRLLDRGRIEIVDRDGGLTQSKSFLQGLITNDIKKCSDKSLIYACFLTPQGKFLHDVFIRESEGKLILDCEGGGRAQDLYKRLVQYRLRKPIEIEVFEEGDVFVSFESEQGAYKDPRHPEMGYRSYIKPNGEEGPFDEWDQKRISLCIPDGSRDLLIEKSTMDEARMDQLNAIDYQKGCYVGQELTARMHYRGLGKKHLAVVRILDDQNLRISEKAHPELGSEILKFRDSEILSPEGRTIGEMRSSCGDIGLALVRDEAFK